MAKVLAAAGNEGGTAPARLIDLREIDSAHRALMWSGAASQAFPGLSLKLATSVPQLGTISRFGMADGELVAVESAAVEVSYRPPARDGFSPHVSLMVQSRGATRVRQYGRQCDLAEGDLCLIDESSAFRLVGEDDCAILFLRLPRTATLSRHPQLERLYAHVSPANDVGTRLLGDTLRRLFDDAPRLDELQRAAMMDAVIHMLGVVGPLSMLPDGLDWRVRRAIDCIERNLGVAGFSAEDVAHEQNISRRRLDQLMQAALDQPISGYLWNRRLERAAQDLRDPRRAGLTAAQIAFANGFEDAAHFTRAFKRRYACTPGQWRLN